MEGAGPQAIGECNVWDLLNCAVDDAVIERASVVRFD